MQSSTISVITIIIITITTFCLLFLSVPNMHASVEGQT